MSTTTPKIAIVGAGLSGLVAAIVLEEQGIQPVIYEATDRIGGRVKTDMYEGVPLDHGFQVLLTEYPMTRKYLDYDALRLKRFLPGAVLWKDKKTSTLGDPIRNLGFLLPTLFSTAGSISDKWKIFRLSAALKKMPVAQAFATPNISTLQLLTEYGFSKRIINNFFKPFFSGIFLEDALQTSSRMFQFVYKLFSQGDAAIPEKGMQEIPQQLFSKLRHTQLFFNKRVDRITERTLHFLDGNTDTFDAILIATDPTTLLPQLAPIPVKWYHTETFYFKAKESTIKKPLIGLLTAGDTLVNNIHFVTDLISTGSPFPVLSATVVKDHQLSSTDLIEQVTKELSKHLGLEGLQFIKSYSIDKALPILEKPQYNSRLVTYSKHIYLAGDHLANGSINAAMLSGETAANEIIKTLGATT